MKERIFLLLLFSSLSTVKGIFEHTYLPHCLCSPSSIDTTVQLTVFTRGIGLTPDIGDFFQNLLPVTLTVAGTQLGPQNTIPNTGRIPLKIDAGLPYTTVTKIINVPKNIDISVWIDLLIPLAANIPVDASSAFSLNIPRFSDPEALVMEFPENSFSVDDITVWMSVWTAPFGTPGNADLESVPGDFRAIDDGGKAIGLISEGVFSIQFTDANNQAVPLEEAPKLSVKESVLLDISATPTLYGLNKNTGFWEFNSHFVPLGNGILEASVEVSPDVNDFTIGYTFDICVMKVFLNNLDGNFGVDVSITQSFSGSNDWVFSNNGHSQGDLCLRVACCKPNNPTCSSLPKLKGTLYAILESDIAYSAPEAEDNGFSDELNAALEYEGGGSIISVIEAGTGPIYPSIEQCKAGELHFTFSFD